MGGVLATPLVQHLLELHSGVQYVLSWDVTSHRAFEIDRVLDNGGIVPQVLVVLQCPGICGAWGHAAES